AIFDQYEVAYNSTSAAMLTFVLLLLCLTVLVLERLIRGNFNYASSRKGVSGGAEYINLGWRTVLVLLGFATLVLFAIGVPFFSLVYWLLTGSSAVFDWAEIGSALLATVGFGLSGSLLAILFAIPLVILAIRH